jgi:hypothetical protein
MIKIKTTRPVGARISDIGANGREYNVRNLDMTQTQALTRALVLALCAPNDAKAQQAAELAEQFAQGLSDATVEQCKANALAERDR